MPSSVRMFRVGQPSEERFYGLRGVRQTNLPEAECSECGPQSRPTPDYRRCKHIFIPFPH